MIFGTGGYERIRNVRVHRRMPVFIDHVDRKPVPGFHQDIQISPARMHCHPPRVVTSRRSVDAIDKSEVACLAILSVRPDLVSPQVGRVEIGFAWIEDHSMYARLGNILVVLNVRLHTAGLVDGEHVAVAGVVVEGVSIDIVRRFLSC